jgi:hypothetical protein
MTEDTIKKAPQEAGIPDMITCPKTFAIAAKAKVSQGGVGKYRTKNRIRIRGSQLGCFP